MPRPKQTHRLSHKDLRQINLFVTQGKYQKAAKILKRGLPISEVIAELRVKSSAQAQSAQEAGNYQAVILHLEAYLTLAKQYRAACLADNNQEPPGLDPDDQGLLVEARQRLC